MNYIYLSDIHSNFSALKHLKDLEEFSDNETQFRYGGDYIDGFQLEKDAVINTLRFIKEHCETGNAQAIIGNHDDFIIKAAFNPYAYTDWWQNGRAETLANLNLSFVYESDLREQLLHFYYEEMDWLHNLPYVIEDGKNILVHAGLNLSLSLEKQSRDVMLWTREPYWKSNTYIDFYEDKTIITGHTPTGYLIGKEFHPILNIKSPNRYFIDGGSKGGKNSKGRINLLKLDEEGNLIWKKYLTEDGIFDY